MTVLKVCAWEGKLGWHAVEATPRVEHEKFALLIQCDSEEEREMVLEAIQPALAAVQFAKTLQEPKS